jgi:shikimate kinase
MREALSMSEAQRNIPIPAQHDRCAEESPIRPDVILIGPIRSGKSTIAALLAEELGVPQVSLDEVCWDYYPEAGFVPGDAECLGSDGMIASRFNVHAVERTLSDHNNCVIDLGAGHSVYRDEASLARLESALAPYPNVFLLLPSPDLEESYATLRARNVRNEWLIRFTEQHGYDPNEHFLRHPSNFRLAQFIIYTEGKSPEETRDEILSKMECRPQRSRRVGVTRQQEEIVQKLGRALEAAKRGTIRSLVLLTLMADGRSDCWAQISTDQDSRAAGELLGRLRQDLVPPDEGQ